MALGFGSQSLVKDFLSGLFILIEDQFGVGDIVDLGDATGTVEVVSLRTTRLRASTAPSGTSRTARSTASATSRSTGRGRCWTSRSPTGATSQDAREVIKRVADEVWNEEEVVIEEPDLWGVEDLGAHGVDAAARG